MEVLSRRITVSLAVVAIMGLVSRDVAGHGMLLDPPNRSSIWRFRDTNPAFENATENWTDNELYCGGRETFQKTGKCGICGDNYFDPMPRKNEDGGIYGQGIIVRSYKSGQVMQVKVNLTTSHYGYFQFHLCEKEDISSHLDETCYEKYLLEIISSSNKFVWLEKNGWIEAKARGANFVEEEEDQEDLKQSKASKNNCAVTTIPTTTKKPTKKSKTTTTPTTRGSTTSKPTKSPKPVTKSPKPKTTPTTRLPVTSTTQTTTKLTTTVKANSVQKPVNERITKYYITTATSYPPDAPAEHVFGVKLPKGIKSNKAVLRFTYTTGNDWGLCEDGTSRQGCGLQETFKSCADISIL